MIDAALEMQQYDYPLPDSLIARHPLEERDASRLLAIDIPSETITHTHFSKLPDLIPPDSLLWMNASRVIAARIPCTKATGGAVEVLLLSPAGPSADPAIALASRNPSEWMALIGGKRISAGDRLQTEKSLTIQVLHKEGAHARVQLQWLDKTLSLAALLDEIGKIPLPPYLKREQNDDDPARYQTIYAERPGSVAAPTAGLHFSAQILSRLNAQNVRIEKVHLHVGAGTFKPIDVENARHHDMHAERIEIPLSAIEGLAEATRSREKGGSARVVAVGTTSLRTLESLAIAGQRLCQGGALVDQGFLARQWDGRAQQPLLDSELFGAIAQRMRSDGLPALVGMTSLMIAPGFGPLHVDRLITNFHQPRSSLLLLVAAFSLQAGSSPPLWRRAYDEALRERYRFLSFGDSSIWIKA